MAGQTERRISRTLLEHYPRTYGAEVGLGSLGTPSRLFQLLVLSMLMGARIRASVALEAAQALFDHKWTRADRMAAASWEERAGVLNDAGYARFDERTSTMLGEAASMLQDKYSGDLRRLRDKASRDRPRLLYRACAQADCYFAQACTRGWEGLIAKETTSTYAPRRSSDWLKLKCSAGQRALPGEASGQ